MEWLKKHGWLILALTVAVLAGRMLLTTKHFYTHDDIQVFRLHEFVDCFEEGQIPCRWSDELGKGYGYPWFNYYPPMIYVMPGVLHTLGISLVTSLNLFMFATFLLAAWSMYLLVKEVTKRDDVAALASMLYTLYPFHAINVFVRGVSAENLAWSFAPLILLLLYRQLTSGRTQKWLPALFGALLLTHIISSFILTAFALAWVIGVAIVHKRNLAQAMRKVACQLLVGVGLAAFFFGPALLEKNLVQSTSLTEGYFAYTNHYVSSNQLFKEYKWNYEGSFWNEAADEMPFMVGHIHTTLLVIVVLSVSVLWVKKKIKKEQAPRMYMGILLCCAAFAFLFLAHFKSDPIWSLIPPLAYIQFPWRFIVWAGLPLALALALFVSLMPQKGVRLLIPLTMIALVIYSYPFFFPKSYDPYNDYDLISGSQKTEQQSKSLYDYLPKTVHKIPVEFAEDSSAPYKVFYFPGWTATVDGEPVAIMPDPTSGLIVPVGAVSGELQLDWQETPLRLAMDLVSVITLVGYGLYLYKARVQ